jgi:hypothetical protein
VLLCKHFASYYTDIFFEAKKQQTAIFLMNEKFVLPLAFLLLSLTSIAQGNLLIFPKRISFDNLQKRIETINLSNVGKDTATYTLSYNEIRMGEDGSFNSIKIAEKGQNFASPYLRYYPRTVTLAPNESQNVKIQLIKTNELKQGEYRSHLYFRAVPKITLLKKEPLDSIAKQTKGLSINLVPVFGLSIANIITIGENTTTVQLTNLALEHSKEENTTSLSLDFNRQGNRSAYGTIEVNHISFDGTTTQAGIIKGFAIYSPGNLRKSKIELDNSKNIDYAQGKLEVRFSTEDKLTLYAEATLELNHVLIESY